MTRFSHFQLAAIVSLVAGCSDKQTTADKTKVTHDAPPEAMAVIPVGEYVVSPPFLAIGQSCTPELRRELDKFIGQPQRDAKQAVTAFAIDKRRVSCTEFLDCVRQNGCKVTSHSYDDLLKNKLLVCSDDDARVSAQLAEAYCTWRGRRLPTFLEWQVAARGRDGAGVVDPECVQRDNGTLCRAVSSFGVLVSAARGNFEEEITSSMDCFPMKLMGDREGEDELGRVRTVAVTGAREINGKMKLVLDMANPEMVIVDDQNEKHHGGQFFRCAGDVGAPSSKPSAKHD